MISWFIMQCVHSAFSVAHRHDVPEIIIKPCSRVIQSHITYLEAKKILNYLCAHVYRGGDSNDI